MIYTSPLEFPVLPFLSAFCSFVACYTSELCPLEPVAEGGVPLEHLLTCVPGVKVAISASGIKKVQWAENKPPPVIGKTNYDIHRIITILHVCSK